MNKFVVSTGMATMGLLGLIAGGVQAAPATNVLISTFALVGLYSPTNSHVVTSNADGTVLTVKVTANPASFTTKDAPNPCVAKTSHWIPLGCNGIYLVLWP
jgi:hypothetical protein